MVTQVHVCTWIAIFSCMLSCGKKKEDDKSASTFPNIYTTAKLAVPSFEKAALTSDESFTADSSSLALAGTVPSTTTNFGTSADWTKVSGLTSNTIGQFLTDAGPGGTGKSLWTLLNGVQGTIQTINTDWADSNGDPKNCTVVPSSTAVKAPFWSTATGSIVTIEDSGKYKCYVKTGNVITVFGRHAIDPAPASCTDAFEYYVLSANASPGVANTGDASYGATSDGGGSSRFYYHGCDKTLKLQMVSFTKYSGGTEFSLRTEVVGNVATSSFTMRAAWIDFLSSGGGGVYSVVGSGTTFKVGSTNGAFLVGDLVANCPTRDTCAASAGAFNYCIENTGSATSSMAVASANTTCSGNTTLAAAYTGLSPIADIAVSGTVGIPRALFTVTTEAMGLP